MRIQVPQQTSDRSRPTGRTDPGTAAAARAWPSAPPPSPPIGTPSGTAFAVAVPPAPPRPDDFGPAPVPPRPRRTGLVVASVLAVFAVLAAILFAGVRLRQEDAPTASPPTTSPAPISLPSTSAPPTTSAPRSTTPRDPGSSGTPTAPIDEEQVKAEVASLQQFVERERELTFKNDVEVEVLASEAFKTRVLEEFESETEAMQKQAELFKAMGLVPADLDVVEAQRALLGDGVLGFYDPVTKELVVRGDQIGPFFREIVVHELTHALDDQYFPLDRPDLTERKDGSDWAFLALVEGNARRVEFAYTAQLSPADQQTLAEEQMQLGLDQMDSVFSMPMILPRILMAPYDYGNPFVKALLAKKGNAGIDRAYDEPPRSSEQILDEAKFEAGEGPVPVDRPPAEGEVIDEGTLGELMTGFMLNGGDSGLGLDGLGGGGLFEGMDEQEISDLINGILSGEIDPSVLEGSGGGPSLPGETPDNGGTGGVDLDSILGGNGEGAGGQFGPVKTVKGWGGDHYVVYRSATDGVCLRADWKMDTATDLSAMETALRTWSTTSKATVERPTDETVRATRCSGTPAGGGSGATTTTTAPTRVLPPR